MCGKLHGQYVITGYVLNEDDGHDIVYLVVTYSMHNPSNRKYEYTSDFVIYSNERPEGWNISSF